MCWREGRGHSTLTNVTPVGNTAYPRFTVAIVGGKVTFLMAKLSHVSRTLPANGSVPPSLPMTNGSSLQAGRHQDQIAMQDLCDGDHEGPRLFKDSARSPIKYSLPSRWKTFTSDSKKVTINFGDGACDNKVTITSMENRKRWKWRVMEIN